jgi:hypothetical protein
LNFIWNHPFCGRIGKQREKLVTVVIRAGKLWKRGEKPGNARKRAVEKNVESRKGYPQKKQEKTIFHSAVEGKGQKCGKAGERDHLLVMLAVIS